MKANSILKSLLKQISQITRMERGKLCKIRTSSTGTDYYNLQSWENGHNVVRYIPQHKVQDIQKGIAGYKKFIELTQKYADEVIALNHKEDKSATHNKINPTRKRQKKAPL